MQSEQHNHADYISEAKNNKIKMLRDIFSKIQTLPKTETEEAYVKKLSSSRPVSTLSDASIEDLLAFHWRGYDFQIWKKAIDKIADLLILKQCELVFESGVGTGAPLSHLNETYPNLGVAGNDFFKPFINLAKASKHIGDGAFLYSNSQHLNLLAECEFDAVFALGSIGYENKHDTQNTIKNLIKICRSGGRILIGSLDNSEVALSKDYGSAFQTSFYKNELEELMKNEPVTIIELDTDNKITGMQGHAADTRLTICLEKK